MLSIESIPVLALLPSLIGAFILVLFGKKPNLRDTITVIATIITFIVVGLIMLPEVLDGNKISYTLFEILPGLSIAFKVDSFGMFFALVTAALWIATNIYAIGYMRGLKEHAQTRFFFYFTLSIFAALGIAFSGNLLTIFVFYEILSIVTYPLVIHEEDKKSMRSGTEYMIYLMVASMGLQLLAILLIYGLTGTLDYTDGGFLNGHGGALIQTAIFLLLLFGYAKSAIFPLHSWLPAAMVAPTPVSALLHAVAVVVAGVFCVMRIVFDVFGPDLMKLLHLDLVLGSLAAFTLLAAIFFGLTQDNLKRRIAYSTVSQLSFMMLGAALLTKSGMIGGILHIASHSFGKIVLFFVAGAIFVASGKKLISEMDGIGRKMPLTMFAFTIGVLAMIATPLTLAYISKGLLLEGSMSAGYIIFFAVFVSAAFLDAIYFFPIIFKAYFKKIPAGEKEEKKEAPILVLAPIIAVSIFVVLLYFVPFPFLQLAEEKISSTGFIPDTLSEETVKHWSELTEYGVLTIIVVFLLLNYRFFGAAKGKEIIRFDTDYIYRKNSLVRICKWSNKKILKFYSYAVDLSKNPVEKTLIFLTKKPDKIKKILNATLQSYLSNTIITTALYLVAGFIIIMFLRGGL